ncbi:MAG: hypothetical protein Q8755_03055, partial [Candidatus Phytoplasma australasiaticum]|nr:hypothetical protein [Candidatus Phytoplasma australasiaticum]
FHLKGYEDKTEESLCEMIDLQQKILKKHNLHFDYSNFLSFWVDSIKGCTINEKFSMNLR